MEFPYNAPMRHGFFFPTVLILLGLGLLLENLGVLRVPLWDIVSVWWPVLFIGLGVALFLTPNQVDKKKQTMGTKQEKT